MRCASIDVGTNTLRLLIADVVDDGTISTQRCERIITRLGGGYTERHGIDEASAQRTVDALCRFREIMDQSDVKDVAAVATSVVRRAANCDRFLDEARKKAGFTIEVITGDEEARLTLLGVFSVVNVGRDERVLIVDIGGGSTEYIAARGGQKVGAWSMDLGVVHLAETHFASDPPLDIELRRMEDEIRGVLSGVKEDMAAAGVDPAEYCAESGAILVGTAGTITTLAALDQALEQYDPTRINNYILTSEAIHRIYTQLAALSLRERERVLTLGKGREDLIIPGSVIVLATMRNFRFDTMKVSDAGLLEGILISRIHG